MHRLLAIVLILGWADLAAAVVAQPRTLVSGGGSLATSGVLAGSSNVGDVIAGRSAGGASTVWHGFYSPVSPTLVDVPRPFPTLPVLALAPPSPNPVRTRAAIRLTLAGQRAGADLTVFDVTGRQVRALARGLRSTGNLVVDWDARDDRGARVPPGVYLVRLATTAQRSTVRLVVMP